MSNIIINSDTPEKSPFDSIRRHRPDGSEYWLGRELMSLFGYPRWENFGAQEARKPSVIQRAIVSTKVSQTYTESCFRYVTQTSFMPNGGAKIIEDCELTRYAAYIVAMCGDVTKADIAMAQSYFAVKTNEAENSKPAMPQTYIEALQETLKLAIANQQLEDANKALQVEVKTLEPKAEAWDLVLDTDGWLSGEDIVKQLAVPQFSVKKLYEILRTEKILFKRPADTLNRPYAEWINDGLAKLRNASCYDGIARFTPVFSWKGLERILDVLRKHNVVPKNKQYRFDFGDRNIVAMKRA